MYLGKREETMFIAHVGSGTETHRILSACFTKGSADGSAFCGEKGEVKFPQTDKITCDKCRATIVKSILKSPPVKGRGP
jgi:hypothetical protein